MRFQSVNEIEQFGFEDAQMSQMSCKPGLVSFELEALIVKPRNSQNEQCTESYAGTTLVRFEDGEIVSALEEGYKRYDADNHLIEQEDDRPLSTEEIEKLQKDCEGYYLYAMDCLTKEENHMVYELVMESDEENERGVTRSYRVTVSFSKAIFGWDIYLNRVQK